MRRKLTVVIALVFSALLVAGIAYASIPGPTGVINGCYKNTDGSLKVIDSTATCPNGYTALNWNQTGPQGPGLANVHTTTTRCTIAPLAVNPNEQSCKAGAVSGQWIMTAGWAFAYGPNGENPEVLPIVSSRPDTPTTYSDNWTLSFYGGQNYQDVVVFAVRANVPA